MKYQVKVFYGLDPDKPYTIGFNIGNYATTNVITDIPDDQEILDWLAAGGDTEPPNVNVMASALMYPFGHLCWPPLTRIFRVNVVGLDDFDPDVQVAMFGNISFRDPERLQPNPTQNAIPGAVLGIAGYTQTGRYRPFNVGLYAELLEGLPHGGGMPPGWETMTQLASVLADHGFYPTGVINVNRSWLRFSNVPAILVHRVRHS